MDTYRIKRLRTYLTAHFAVIACLASTLVANSGDRNYFLPVLVILVAATSLVLVDILEIFYLGKIGSYLGMSLASLAALSTLALSVYYQNPEEVQFMAVASLLIYPQCVLFFQKKSLRVYEQLAIFLLLEMIVAALINDNVVYGLFLAPIVVLWVSSLFLVARYATLVEVSPGIEQPVPLFYELIYQKFLRRMKRASTLTPTVHVQPKIESSILSSRKKRSLLLALPLGLAALAFSSVLYYLLPRVDAAGVLGWELNQVGLPDQIRTGDFGRFLMDPSPVMRLKLTDPQGNAYQPTDPPYLRVNVLDRYIPPPEVYEPGHWVHQAPSRPVSTYGAKKSKSGRDTVRVEVALKKDFRKCVICIPPIIKTPTLLNYKPVEMLFSESEDSKENRKRKVLSYRFDSWGFAQGVQLPIISDWDRLLTHENYVKIPELPVANRRRLEILSGAGIAESQLYLAARQLEYHLGESGEYSYTLNLPRPVDEDIDPIEDFLVNQKTGLCQSYASAMVAMLRQMGIASRIVIGFVPVEWNRLGQHFIVRNMDAHAWVEARFSREDLLKTDLEKWLDSAPNYWVRFDPTPSADDSERGIIESNQSLEYAEKLWEDYVSNADKIDQAGLYEGVNLTDSDVGDILRENVRLLGVSLSEGWFQGRRLSFAWPLALAVFAGGILVVGAWQLIVWLPTLAPGLAKKLGIARRRRTRVQQTFFAKCIALIEKLKIVRGDSETMQEYTQRASSDSRLLRDPKLASEFQNAVNWLRAWYYRARFGPKSAIDNETRSQIDQHLQTVENAVRAAKQSKRKEA